MHVDDNNMKVHRKSSEMRFPVSCHLQGCNARLLLTTFSTSRISIFQRSCKVTPILTSEKYLNSALDCTIK